MQDKASLVRRLRRAAGGLLALPIHPQWLMQLDRDVLDDALARVPAGATVVDVGCGHRWPASRLPAGCRYVGIDYPTTATDWYGSRPDLFADAGALPLADACADRVLLLDVLEHVPDADAALAEAARVLRPGGLALLRIPFAYPLHDEPLDFRRYTRHGIAALAIRHGLQVEQIAARGHPATTGALLANLAVARALAGLLAGGVAARLAGVLAALPAVLAITATNLVAFAASRLLPADDTAPYSYTAILRCPPARDTAGP